MALIFLIYGFCCVVDFMCGVVKWTILVIFLCWIRLKVMGDKK